MHSLFETMTVTAGGPDQASIAVAGEVDASNADRLRRAILENATRLDAPLVVDLSGITFMDSSGLKAIADASRELGSSGNGLVLCNVPRQVLRLLEITDIGPLEVRP